MDFKGQKLSERLSQIIVTICAFVAFIAGYAVQDFSLMMRIFGSGVAVAFVATVLDWPIYNKDPVAWRRPAQQASGKPAAPGSKRKPSMSVWSLFK